MRNRQKNRILLFMLISFFISGIWMTGCSDSEENSNLEDVKKEAGETGQAVKDYTVQQKDRFMREAETALENLDERTEALEKDLKEKWNELDIDARQRAQETLDTLKEKRETLSDQLSDLKDSSGETWDEMKKGFWESYEKLKDSLDNTKEEVQTT